jgi:salicylate hydroxylase
VFSGGGIGGLSLAIVLKQYGGSKHLAIDLYESEPRFTEIGAGITAWLRTRFLFNALGMGKALDKKVEMPSMTFRKSDTQQPFVWYEHKTVRQYLSRVHLIIS